MALCFELSMPSNNAWNGKWTGEGTCFAIIKNLGRSKKAKEKIEKLLKKGSWYYSFGDGWAAQVDVREIFGAEITAMRGKSQGFCGYNWMVDSILDYGEILNSEQRKEMASAAAT